MTITNFFATLKIHLLHELGRFWPTILKCFNRCSSILKGILSSIKLSALLLQKKVLLLLDDISSDTFLISCAFLSLEWFLAPVQHRYLRAPILSDSSFAHLLQSLIGPNFLPNFRPCCGPICSKYQSNQKKRTRPKIRTFHFAVKLQRKLRSCKEESKRFLNHRMLTKQSANSAQAREKSLN